MSRIKPCDLTVLLQIVVQDIALDSGALEREVVICSRDPFAGVGALDAGEAGEYWVDGSLGGLAEFCLDD